MVISWSDHLILLFFGFLFTLVLDMPVNFQLTVRHRLRKLFEYG